MNQLSRIILPLLCMVMGTAGFVFAGGGCGDGVLQEEMGEQCDDGNLINGDGCSIYCMIEVCGDGILQEALGEQCDDGNLINGDGCNFYCKNEICGDGVLQEALGELCDDGNLIDGDGCSAACALEYGNQGCMPNYWKKSQHIASWPAPFTPDSMFSSVFADAFPGKTLLEVLSRNGSGLHALGRHAVAALLNAASSDVAYDLTIPQVTTMFNTVYSGAKHDRNSLKAILRAYNKRDCPMGGGTSADPDDE